MRRQTVHCVATVGTLLVIVRSVTARFAVVVLRQSIAVAETVGAEDSSIGAIACMGKEFGAHGAGAERQFFDGSIELLAKFRVTRL